jgi:hypothetical protein
MQDIRGTSDSVTKIAAGAAVFTVCWIVQATMGDSSMFSMEYTERGFFQGLLVNITFWPGWLATVALIGSGIAEMMDSEDPNASAEDTNASAFGQPVASPTHYSGSPTQRVLAGDHPPEPTHLMLEKNPHLAQALELGPVPYRVLWLVWSKGGVNRVGLAPRLGHMREEITGALSDLEAAGLIRIDAAGRVTSSVGR